MKIFISNLLNDIRLTLSYYPIMIHWYPDVFYNLCWHLVSILDCQL